ncbi:MAG: hypothetical protein AAGA60_11315 [Cyanobacteria bacterium P01_E01_bin.42]
MSYSFDIIGVSSVVQFFQYQQKVEQMRDRSKAYLGSYDCTLDSFITSTEMVCQKPNWDWDAAIGEIVNFWLKHEEKIKRWKLELDDMGGDNLIVGRVANIDCLRSEFESLF